MLKIVVLGSGSGSSYQSIVDAIKSKILSAQLVSLVGNKKGSGIMMRAQEQYLPNVLVEWDPRQTREEYNTTLAHTVSTLEPDLVVLAGWNLILTKEFIDKFPNLINLHPALPGSFVGKDCIADALYAYRRGEVKYTGCMVHRVIENLDRGEPLEWCEIPIYPQDSYDSLKERVQSYEKGILISAINHFVKKYSQNKVKTLEMKARQGKVRHIRDIGHNLLSLQCSDRLSAFDKYVCDIPGKGLYLNAMSTWWLKMTESIIPNHLLYSHSATMIVRKCTPFPLEIIVRGYITGSMWKSYSNGERLFCGNKLPDGLVKNQKLEAPIVTPTTI